MTDVHNDLYKTQTPKKEMNSDFKVTHFENSMKDNTEFLFLNQIETRIFCRIFTLYCI